MVRREMSTCTMAESKAQHQRPEHPPEHVEGGTYGVADCGEDLH